MPYFRREGHPVVTPQAFLDFVGDHLPQKAFLDLPILTGDELYEAAMAKKSTAGGLDGWAWNETNALSLSWFFGLACMLARRMRISALSSFRSVVARAVWSKKLPVTGTPA